VTKSRVLWLEEVNASQESRILEHQEKERLAADDESKYLQELAPLKAALESMTAKVQTIERERIDQFGIVKTLIEGNTAEQEKLNRNTAALSGALTNNQVRGMWGEISVRRLLEQCGLRPGIDFEEQVIGLNDDGKSIKPDFIIRMPEGKFAALDSKVPYNNFQRAYNLPDTADATDEKRRKEYLEAHAKDVKKHIDTISQKRYYTGLASSPDFTIMFMPSESLMAVTLEFDPTILEYAFESRVALVSPVSLFGVLKALNYMWRQSDQEKATKEVLELATRLYKRMSKVAEFAEKLGRKINDSVTSYNEFRSSLESQLFTTVRELNERHNRSLGDSEGITQLPDLTSSTDMFTKPELVNRIDNEEESI
jgi:DNA recombination protein RmuC